jgi:hypothetical protein
MLKLRRYQLRDLDDPARVPENKEERAEKQIFAVFGRVVDIKDYQITFEYDESWPGGKAKKHKIIRRTLVTELRYASPVAGAIGTYRVPVGSLADRTMLTNFFQVITLKDNVLAKIKSDEEWSLYLVRDYRVVPAGVNVPWDKPFMTSWQGFIRENWTGKMETLAPEIPI